MMRSCPLAALPYPLPEPPHDPRERSLVAQLQGWEIRYFSVDDPRRDYLLRHRMAHLQLWHPAAGVSVLTPSRMTFGRWEFDLPGSLRRRGRVLVLEEVEDVLFSCGLPLPPEMAILWRLYEEFILAPSLENLLDDAEPLHLQAIA